MNPSLSTPARPRSPRTPARALVAVAAAASLLATAACDTADAENREPQPVEGGTLLVSVAAWPTHLDPQLSYVAVESNILNLTTRTLTTYRSEAGAAGSELVPDVATDLGRPSDNNTVWEFTIREDVRWENGEPVTCQDFKYGVERRFSTDETRQSGPRYPLEYLQDNEEPYEGPWVEGNNDGDGLESVECVDQHLIRYHLKQPVGDFGYAVSLPVFGPVPPGGDSGGPQAREAYNREPLSNGPYVISEHTYNPENPQDNLLVLERNPHWDPATDPHRSAYPDRIEITATTDPAVTTNALVDDEGDDRNRIMLDADIAPTFVQQVMTDPELSARVASAPMGAVRYLAINTQRISDVACRQALNYAMNKRKFRSVFGGSLLGDLATTMIPPNLAAHQDFDHYGTGDNPEGQPERAREILSQAEDDGTDCFGDDNEVTYTYPESPQNRRLASTIVESYQRIGVHVATDPIPAADYFGTILGERHGSWDLQWVGWVPDWPNGSSVIPPLFDGSAVGPGSVNLSYLDNERINEMIDAALAESDLERQYLLWGELDSEISELAATIPLMYNDALRMHGSNVAGAFIHPQYTMPDLSAVGLIDPSLSGSPQE